jgi:hypothetical protein
MPTRDDFAWFKQTFHRQIEPAIAGTPFTLDLLAAIAAQETGHIWASLRHKLPLDELLEVCVGDTLDADRGRVAFPKTKADLIAVARGEDMFRVAREALVKMSGHVPSFAPIARRPDKFCHGYGIFQYDIQFFKQDPDYFLEKQWCRFDAALVKCIQELQAARRRIGLAGRSTLSDMERVHVAIAYNAGTFRPAKGLQQGHFDGRQFYGEKIFDFVRISQTASIPGQPAPIPAPPPGAAPISPPTPVIPIGEVLEVDVKDSPLRLRREPRVDTKDPLANVIARLPDGHRVMLVGGEPDDEFVEVETSLNGAHLRGFAASRFLVRPAAVRARGATLESVGTGVVEVHALRAPGTVTKRTATAGPHPLNEPRQPARRGGTPDELRRELHAIVRFLAVDRRSHRRYQPKNGRTFSSVYAHDYCHLAGVYLPRAWWTPDAIERLTRGDPVAPRLESTIDEQRADDLFRWLRAFGDRFGWRQTGSVTRLQTEANAGAVALMVAKGNTDGRSGHVAVVVPETHRYRARRNASGEVVAPLQSQAGRKNFRYGTGGAGWWNREAFDDAAFWIHA